MKPLLTISVYQFSLNQLGFHITIDHSERTSHCLDGSAKRALKDGLEPLRFCGRDGFDRDESDADPFISIQNHIEKSSPFTMAYMCYYFLSK
jgi:hypothetical protein